MPRNFLLPFAASFVVAAVSHGQVALLQQWNFNDDASTPPSETAVVVPGGPQFSSDGNGHLTTGNGVLQIQRSGTPANSLVTDLNIPVQNQYLRLDVTFAGWHFESSETNRRALTIGFMTSGGLQTAEFEMRPSDEMALRAVAFGGDSQAQPLVGVPIWGLSRSEPVTVRLEFNNAENSYAVFYDDGGGWVTHFSGIAERDMDRIRIGAFVDYGETEYFHIDTISFYAIPEPSTYAAIFGGLALLGAFVWRRRVRK